MRKYLTLTWYICKITPLAIRHAMGRLYVFRDAPIDVVNFVASTPTTGCDDTQVLSFIVEARKEMNLRLDKLTEDVEELKKLADELRRMG